MNEKLPWRLIVIAIISLYTVNLLYKVSLTSFIPNYLLVHSPLIYLTLMSHLTEPD